MDLLEASLREALRTPEGVAKPVAILWPDADRQWQSPVERLRDTFPQLFTLGDYATERRTRPAIWLRCLVDRALPEVPRAAGVVPMLCLPGVSRQDLRAGEECPPKLQPLVELQFRGRVWHQRNGRAWTVEAFLASDDGLGLDVAQDTRTKEAALRGLGQHPFAPQAQAVEHLAGIHAGAGRDPAFPDGGVAGGTDVAVDAGGRLVRRG